MAINFDYIQSSYAGATPSTGREVETAFNENFKKLKARLDNDEGKLDGFNATITNINNELTGVKQSLTTLTNDYTAKIKAVQDDLNKSKQDVSKLQTDLATVQTDLAAINKNVDDKIADFNTTLNNKIKDLTDDVDKTIADLTDDVDDKMQAITDSVATSLTAFNDYLTDSIGDMNDEIAAVKDDLTKLAKDFQDVVDGAISDMQDKLDKLAEDFDTEIDAIKTSITSVNDRLTEINKTATAAFNLASQANDNIGLAIDDFNAKMESLDNDKVDNGYWEDGFLYLTSNGIVVSDPIEIQGGGGGGGGGGSTVRLINLGAASVGVAAGEQVLLKYSFSSVDADTGDPTGSGTAVYFVNNVRVFTQNIEQGNVSFDITKFLIDGTNAVKIQVTDSYGTIRSLNIRVELINLQMRSSFDDSLIYDASVDFPYTPIGTGEKTIHFVLDGVALETVVTTASNRQLNYRLPALAHGSHTLRAYATMIVGGVELRSNELFYSILYVESANKTVIISSSFDRTEVEQYDTLVIPFSVYTPDASTSQVQLKVNGTVVSNLVVDRNQQRWSYRADTFGAITLEIVSGTASKVFSIDVTKSSIEAEAETTGLELYLTSNGRSNSEITRDEWKYESIESSLTGFNFVSNGWMLDNNGVSVLRVSSDAKVEIPFKPFLTDFKNAGKAIEFELSIHDVEDFNLPVITCWQGNRGFEIRPNELKFSSALSSLTANFKEDELVRLSIVVENRYDKRLILLYINGIASGAQQYATTDDFSQASPVGITIGNKKCTVDIYNIRSYAIELNSYQILNNYIADTAFVSKKLAIYERNQIYDAAGEILYNKLVATLPCMTIIGDLPTFKGDKKTVKVTFDHLQEPSKSFTADNVQIDVQGTSSQFYPRKNFKTKFRNGFDMVDSGVNEPKYVLLGNDYPASVFCEKADFAESSGTHNTGMAKLINNMLVTADIKTPPQRTDSRVRTTVDGFPMAIFHKETDTSQPVFVGKYNFNHDKDAEEVFGFDNPTQIECWEFNNNTSDLCLFKSADFSGNWNDDLEARYPDGFTDNTNIVKLWQWVVACKGNTSKFRSEVAQHFNMNNLISYYVITELFGMVDQRAKNQFVTSWGNEGSGEYKWYFIFYDNDTICGLNNEGAIAFNYNIESQDIVGSGHAWNGWDSELWKLVEDTFPVEIEQMYKDLRTSGVLTYDTVSHMLNVEQCEKWCEVVYNMDGQFKYIQPIVDEGNASYLYALQGSRIEHRKWWLSNRMFYIDSKYNTGTFLNDFVSMRLYTPSSWTGVAPNANFNLALYKDSYVRVKYGSYVLGRRASAGETVAITAPAIQFNDTETIVYGVSAIQSLGDLSAKYPGTVDISNAKKLVELVIGSAVAGYSNENLTHISIGNNTLLRKLDIQNCPNLTEPIDLSGCDNIQEIYAEGSNISMVVLPPAGLLHTLHLPSSIVNLTIKNQPELDDDGFKIGGIDKVSTLVLEHMNSIDQLALVKSMLAKNPRTLNRVRLIGVDVSDYDLSVLFTLTKIAGLDESGNQTPTSVVTGTFRADTCFRSELEECQDAYPELNIIVATIQEDPETTFIFESSKSGETLTNVSFLCNRPYTKINDYTYKVAAPVGFLIEMTLSADNHVNAVRTYTVTTTRTQTFTIMYVPIQTIVFKDTSNNVIVGANVVIDGDNYTSDSEGKIFVRSASKIDGVAEKEDYGNASFSFAASASENTYNVTVYPFVTVTFYATEELLTSLVPDVYIEVRGKTVKTDPYGKATMRISGGVYPMKVTYDGNVIDSYTEINVGVADFTLRLAGLPTTFADLVPNKDNDIQLYALSTTANIGVSVNSSSIDYQIDWGDGDVENAKGIGSQGYVHTYNIAGITRLIRIKNCSNISYIPNIATGQLKGILCIGDSMISTTSFSSSTLLLIGNDIFKNSKPATSINNAFKSCQVLSYAQDGILSPLTNAESADGAFEGRILETIPYGLFDDNVRLSSVKRIFYGCTAISEVKEDVLRGLLPVNVNSDTTTSAFENCTSLMYAEIPSNMAYLSASMFAGCTSLEYINMRASSPPIITASTFPSQCIIYVPDSAVAAYKAADVWSTIASRIKPISEKP